MHPWIDLDHLLKTSRGLGLRMQMPYHLPTGLADITVAQQYPFNLQHLRTHGARKRLHKLFAIHGGFFDRELIGAAHIRVAQGLPCAHHGTPDQAFLKFGLRF